MPVVIVAGPPCAGKNVHIDAAWKPGDIVIDFDDVMAVFTRQALHVRLDYAHWIVFAAINAAIVQVAQQPVAGTTWIPIGSKERATKVRSWIPQASVVEIDPGREIVTQRAKERPDPDQMLIGIADWYNSTVTPFRQQNILVRGRASHR